MAYQYARKKMAEVLGVINMRQFALRYGISESTLKRLKNPEDDYNPSVDVLAKIANGLNLHPGDFFEPET